MINQLLKVPNWCVIQAKEIQTQIESMDSFKTREILKYVSIDELLRSTMNIGI